MEYLLLFLCILLLIGFIVLYIILSRIEKNMREDFRMNRAEISSLTKDNRAELNNTLREIKRDLNDTLRDKLERVRETVDEKLTKTLNERLGQTFEQVSKHLESVQKGIGEMQTLATDVGGLKKVLSNVKIRGAMGEVQLAMLLEQLLAPNQYDKNVRTKSGSSDAVEFAIKLPGSDDSSFVYMPVDAKFPKDAYEHLINAYENANPDDIEPAIKNLEITIRRMARDIRDKYIDPPDTTDFAVMFLPFEGIYAEVIRRTALIDQLQSEYKITVAGPTTFAAILNSLQMGFRTLALQKRSSEVWQILGAVKSEFNKFGGLLEKAQKNIHSASDTVDELLGKRTRAITRRLKNIEEMPGAGEIQNLLPEDDD
ncbi:MAG: DNA recombination protein RmuC [Chitinophagaceae bacterium]|nr:DNA recombination protein RmuC [Chitinophagaceae bacterium]